MEFFGYIQLGGIIVSTIIGLIFDKNIIGRKDVKQAEISRRCKLQSAVLPFALTTILGTMLSALAITESVYTLVIHKSIFFQIIKLSEDWKSPYMI